MISKDILDKFKKLYKKKYEIILTDEETTQMANDLVNLMRILLKPEPKSIINEVTREEGKQDENIRTL